MADVNTARDEMMAMLRKNVADLERIQRDFLEAVPDEMHEDLAGFVSTINEFCHGFPQGIVLAAMLRIASALALSVLVRCEGERIDPAQIGPGGN